MSGPIDTPASGLETNFGAVAPGATATLETVGSVAPFDSIATLASVAAPGSPAAAPLPLQVAVEGGAAPVVIAAVVTFFVATILSVLVTYRFVEGYRRTRAHPILLLAVGMFLLAPAPMFLRLLAGNLEAVPLSAQLLLTTLSELCGLLVVLYVVYTT